MPKVNGSGDAYQNWNSAHASATVKITLAVTPAGFRAPVSALATSSCSASGAFSMSVAMRVPPAMRSNGRGEVASAPGRSPVVGPVSEAAGRHLIQPFSR